MLLCAGLLGAASLHHTTMRYSYHYHRTTLQYRVVSIPAARPRRRSVPCPTSSCPSARARPSRWHTSSSLAPSLIVPVSLFVTPNSKASQMHAWKASPAEASDTYWYPLQATGTQHGIGADGAGSKSYYCRSTKFATARRGFIDLNHTSALRKLLLCKYSSIIVVIVACTRNDGRCAVQQ